MAGSIGPVGPIGLIGSSCWLILFILLVHSGGEDPGWLVHNSAFAGISYNVNNKWVCKAVQATAPAHGLLYSVFFVALAPSNVMRRAHQILVRLLSHGSMVLHARNGLRILSNQHMYSSLNHDSCPCLQACP